MLLRHISDMRSSICENSGWSSELGVMAGSLVCGRAAARKRAGIDRPGLITVELARIIDQ